MAIGSQNLTTYYAKRIVGDDATAASTSALLQTGIRALSSGASSIDTWIFSDTNLNTSYGIKYENGTNKYLKIYGNAINTASINIATGDTQISGKIGIGYNPETSGNNYKLYVNGTTYLNDNTTINGHEYFEDGKGIYFYYDNTSWPILENYSNANTTFNACGGGIHIGYNKTSHTCIYYTNADNSVRTKFFEVNSNGSYALTRFGVNGQSTSYNLYVNGTGYINNTLTTTSNIVKAGSSVSWYQGRNVAIVKTTSYSGYNSIYSLKTTDGDWSCGVYTSNILYWTYITDTNYNANTNTVTAQMKLTAAGYLYATRVYNAVWNDYAEFRECDDLPPGTCVQEQNSGHLIATTKRLTPGASIISDTYGSAQGETDIAKTPIAVSGRVLAYPYRAREKYKAGQAVCSAPNGTIDIMTRKEIKEYPDAIVGIVSEIPIYKKWGTGDVEIDGRIWIKVK